jgi:tRNA(Ile)-lysidine synthase
MDIVDQVLKYCIEYNLLTTDDRVLLAVSGGPDSIALLHIMLSLASKIRFDAAVAHLEHGLRETEALNDQRFVKKIANDLGLRFHTKSVSVPEERHRDESIEEAARRLRYEFFYDLLRTERYSKIATGHTLDDNIETVLLRLINGTGPSGFSGILPRSERVIHPLLCLTREQIMYYLSRDSLRYRTDKTNYDLKYPRNRIRHDVIPVLKGINQQYSEHVQRLVDIIREENNILRRVAKEKLERLLMERTDDVVRLRYREFIDLEPAMRRRVIIEIVEHLDSMSGTAIRSYLPYKVIKFLAMHNGIGNKTLYQKGSLIIQIEYGTLLFKKSVVKAQDNPYLYYVDDTGDPVHIDEIQRTAIFHIREEVETFESRKLYFDYRKLTFPIVIRSRKEGDRIVLANLGSKKVKSLFIDEKVSKEVRGHVPIIESDGEVCGVFLSPWGKENRCAASVMITAGTDKIFECELI